MCAESGFLMRKDCHFSSVSSKDPILHLINNCKEPSRGARKSGVVLEAEPVRIPANWESTWTISSNAVFSLILRILCFYSSSRNLSFKLILKRKCEWKKGKKIFFPLIHSPNARRARVEPDLSQQLRNPSLCLTCVAETWSKPAPSRVSVSRNLKRKPRPDLNPGTASNIGCDSKILFMSHDV